MAVFKKLARECSAIAVQGGGPAESLPGTHICAHERASIWHLPAVGTCHIRLCQFSSNTSPPNLTQRSHSRKERSENQTTIYYRISSQGRVPWQAGRRIKLDLQLIKLDGDLIWTGPDFLAPENWS